MKYLIGKKVGMTQRFLEDGTAVAVTVIEGGPCTVTGIKSQEKDGYEAVQIGYAPAKKLSKPEAGHLKGLPLFKHLEEYPIDPAKQYKKGDQLTVAQFAVGDTVDVTGVSKGRGFQGVVKRHKFGGSPATHGHKDQLRMPGAIGAGGPQHVFKGTRMAGHMGAVNRTVKYLDVIEVIPEQNLILVKGAIPGPTKGLVHLYSDSVSEGTKVETLKTEELKHEEPVKEQKG